VQERRPAIELVAKEMVAAPDERLSGTRLVEIIEVDGTGLSTSLAGVAPSSWYRDVGSPLSLAGLLGRHTNACPTRSNSLQ
jgi:hypothetical protein